MSPKTPARIATPNATPIAEGGCSGGGPGGGKAGRLRRLAMLGAYANRAGRGGNRTDRVGRRRAMKAPVLPVLLVLAIAGCRTSEPLTGGPGAGEEPLAVAPAEEGKDPAKAMALYNKACDGGSALGCGNLGVMYSLGKGVKQDVAKAVKTSVPCSTPRLASSRITKAASPA